MKLKYFFALFFFLVLSTNITSPKINNIKQTPIYTEWDYMQMALIKVESEGNPKAISSIGARGIFQITPIYVAEVNRILKLRKSKNRYNFDDAFNIQKSFEMFGILNSHHQKSKNILKTIKSHNPTAGNWYSKRVLLAINDIKNNPDKNQIYFKIFNDKNI